MIEVNSSVHTRYDELLAELARDARRHRRRPRTVERRGGGRRHASVPPLEASGASSRPSASSASPSSTAISPSSSPCSASTSTSAWKAATTRSTSPINLLRYIPHFIALSASSPFSQGEDTSFETSRLHAVSSFPLAGHTAAGGHVGGVQRVLRRDAGLRHRREHEGFLLGHPAEARVRHGRDPHLRYAAHGGAWPRSSPRMRRRSPRTCCATGARRRSSRMYRVYGYNRFQACRFGFEGELVSPFEQGRVRVARRHRGDPEAPRADRARPGHAGGACHARQARHLQRERQPLASRALSRNQVAARRGAIAGATLARRARSRSNLGDAPHPARVLALAASLAARRPIASSQSRRGRA